MPDSATVADPPPLLVMFNTAFLAPGPVGAKVTTAVVDAAAARVVDAGAPTENCEASAPLTVSGVFKVIAVAVLLVSVTICVAVAGAMIEPNAIAVGAAVNGITGTVTGIVNVALPVQPFVPEACTANVKVPGAVGLPERVPSAPRSSPDGGVPLKMVKV